MTRPNDRIGELIRRLANELLPRVDEISATVTQHVLDQAPDLAPNRSAAEIAVIRESTDQNIGAIIATLAYGVAPESLTPPVGTVALFPQIVAGGGDITTLLHGYRVGHEYVLRAWTAHVAARVDEAAVFYEVLRVSSAHIYCYIDGACRQLVTRYRSQYGAPLTDGGSSPRDHVRALLGEQAADIDAASHALRYDLRGHHLALVAVPLDAYADVRSALDVLAAVTTDATLLAHPVGDGAWWAWLGWRHAPDESAVEKMAAASLDGVLVGMGQPGQGREGFRRSHREAREADRTARLRVSPSPGVIRHRDIEIAALLCTDPERARRVAAERLGGLGARDESTGRLRETVRVYLATGRSVARTADALHVHQKTVAYRLHRASELLGRPVTDATSELESALLIDRTLHGS